MDKGAMKKDLEKSIRTMGDRNGYRTFTPER